MRCKIVRFQKLMWRNMMRSIKSQKVSILHYSIDMEKRNSFLIKNNFKINFFLFVFQEREL